MSNDHITMDDYKRLQAAGQTRQKKGKGSKKAKTDYNSLCALPCWKATQFLAGSDGFVTQYTLPICPSANVYWRNINGKTLVSEDAREYKREVAKLAARLGMRPLDGDVILTLHVYRAQKSGDLSNRIKVIEDALRGVAFHDDKQVVQINAFRYDDPKFPRIVVSVRTT